MLKQNKQILAQKGFSFGRAGTYQPYFPAIVLLALVVFGATAAGVLLLSLIVPLTPRWQYGLVLGLTALLVFPLLKGGGMLVRQATAFGMRCSIPGVGNDLDDRPLAAQRGCAGRQWAHGITAVHHERRCSGICLATFVSMAGALYLGAVLADVRFFWKWNIFAALK